MSNFSRLFILRDIYQCTIQRVTVAHYNNVNNAIVAIDGPVDLDAGIFRDVHVVRRRHRLDLLTGLVVRQKTIDELVAGFFRSVLC